MGVVIEDLWDHEGYAARRLPDGTLTGTWTQVGGFDAYVAACGCGWRGTVGYPPTDIGEELAVDHWRLEHAEPLMADQAIRRRRDLDRVLGWLGEQATLPRDVAAVDRLAGALDGARGLLAEVRRDLEPNAPTRDRW